MSNCGKVFERINKKFESGEFSKGNDYSFNIYCGGVIDDYTLQERTPEVCSSLMDYGKCSIDDIPKESITKEFLMNSFTNKGVMDYILEHLDEFDKQFWLDVIETNKYCTHFENNVFEVMPIKFIDEEMCSLAMIKTMDWSASDWFKSAFKRNKNALSFDVWKLASRIYTCEAKFFMENTPLEYRDEEFYLEFLSCSFNNGISLDNHKRDNMDLIPKEMINVEFLFKLLKYDNSKWYDNYANLGAFNEYALETKINYCGDLIPIWKYLLLIEPNTISHIPLNQERVDFFLSKNDKDSFAYTCYFKKKYKKFLKSNYNESKNNINDEKVELLPIFFRGQVPTKYKKEYDSEEYLKKVYLDLGIKVIGEYDSLFYNIVLPKDWKIKRNGYWNDVLDDLGKSKIKFFYDSKFYDREVYVDTLN